MFEGDQGDQGGSWHPVMGSVLYTDQTALPHVTRRPEDIPNWTPPAVLSCLATPVRPPLRRADIKEQVLSRLAPLAAPKPKRGVDDITPEQRAQAQAVIRARAAARRAPPGARISVDRRLSGADRISEYLACAPEGAAYSAADIALAVGVSRATASSALTTGAGARTYQIRIYYDSQGRHGQYRRVQDAPWPALPAGASAAPGAGRAAAGGAA